MGKRGRKSAGAVENLTNESNASTKGKDSSVTVEMPRKRWYRQRAHASVFSDHDLVYPSCPQDQDWSEIYPDYFTSSASASAVEAFKAQQEVKPQKKVEFADIGCGFGGLLMDLAPLFPDNLILGMEIRSSVTQYVHDRIEALRLAHDQHQYLESVGAVSSSRIEGGKFIIDLQRKDGETYPTKEEGVAQEGGEKPSKRLKTNPDDSSKEEASNIAIENASDLSTSVQNSKSDSQSEVRAQSQTKEDSKKKGKSKKKSNDEEDEDEEDDEEEEYSESLQNSRLLEKARNASGGYKNVGVVRGNAMKFLPNYFERGQLKKIFFLFPDPHFKVRKHKSRIISPTLLSEYAYVLQPGGIIYTITDVHDLHLWMVEHLTNFPAFDRIPNDDPSLVEDPCVKVVYGSTEEGKKVARNGGDKFFAAFRRRADPVEGEE